MNTDPIIVRNQIEDLMEIMGLAASSGDFWLNPPHRASISGPL
jgi:hypothetical protein